MNGDWYPWAVGAPGGSAEDYVAAYRRVRGMFDDAGAKHVEWVWCPNVIVNGDAEAISRCYPGDDFVDIVGVDGYNFGDLPGHRWTEPAELFGATVALVTRSRRENRCGSTRSAAPTEAATRPAGSPISSAGSPAPTSAG